MERVRPARPMRKSVVCIVNLDKSVEVVKWRLSVEKMEEKQSSFVEGAVFIVPGDESK